MKRLLILSVLAMSISAWAADKHNCESTDAVSAQVAALKKVVEKMDADGCPAPKTTEYKTICDSIAIRERATGKYKDYFEYGYETRLMQFACADVTKESRESAAEKVAKMWNKYSKNFKCDASSFEVPNGNVLKFALSQSFGGFIETLVGTYGVDINFIDPADRMNVYDYVLAQRNKASNELGPDHTRTKAYQEYLEMLEGLGAKSSSSNGGLAKK